MVEPHPPRASHRCNFSQISGFTECPEDDGIFLGDFGFTKCETSTVKADAPWRWW